MWFRKKRNIDLFNHKLVEEMDARVSKLLQVPIAKIDREIIEKLSKAEQKLSEIPVAKLLSIFENENDDLTKFICLSHSKESKIDKNQNEVIESNGLSERFSITYAIYYFYLKKDKQSALGEYLSKRRIPEYQKFQDRLKNYFFQSAGVMLSDSYIQYAAGYEKEDVKPQDISKAIQDLQKIDNEHGAIRISVMSKKDEFVIQANKLKEMTLIEGDEETSLTCANWSEVEGIFNLQIAKDFDEILKKFKK